jgi:hypothetical protein
LQMTIGKPILPPPASEASEAAYERLTAELKSTVTAMWNDLRGKNPDGKTAAPGQTPEAA